MDSRQPLLITRAAHALRRHPHPSLTARVTGPSADFGGLLSAPISALKHEMLIKRDVSVAVYPAPPSVEPQHVRTHSDGRQYPLRWQLQAVQQNVHAARGYHGHATLWRYIFSLAGLELACRLHYHVMPSNASRSRQPRRTRSRRFRPLPG